LPASFGTELNAGPDRAGRGVALGAPRYRAVSLDAAKVACLRHRNALGGDWTEAEGLIVWIDCPVPETRSNGSTDRVPVHLAATIPPEQIPRLEVISVDVPSAGSPEETRTLGLSGFARTYPSLAALPSMELAQRLTQLERERAEVGQRLQAASAEFHDAFAPVREAMRDFRRGLDEEFRRRGLR
jgi:hypothetical protein